MWDRDGIGWGDNWIERLQSTLTECAAYVILVGVSGVRRWVKAELHIATRRHFEKDLPVFPILLHGVPSDSLPPFLSIFQAESLPEDLERFDFAELAERLKAIPDTADDTRPAIDEASVHFRASKRSARTKPGSSSGARSRRSMRSGAWARSRWVYRRWLQIEGPSGVGKSSLVRAGLVPAIRRGWIEEGDGQIAAGVAPPLRPGGDPIENLAEALSKGLPSEREPIALGVLDRELRAGSDRALRLCSASMSPMVRAWCWWSISSRSCSP